MGHAIFRGSGGSPGDRMPGQAREEIAAGLEESQIEVAQKAFSDVIFQIGDAIRNLTEKVAHSVVFRDEEGINWRAR